MRESYSKYKECEPNKTIARIRAILDAWGIEVEETSVDGQFTGAHSLRVSVGKTPLGANGKGTTWEYARASGYAELIERIQNDALPSRDYHRLLHSEFGFYHVPDERLVVGKEYLAECDVQFRLWLADLGLESIDEQKQFMESYGRVIYARRDCAFPVIPFYDEFGKRVVWFPKVFMTRLVGTNGMASGNTVTEALVQGLSEVYERYVHMQLLAGGVTPPEMGRADYLRFDGIAKLVEDIERSGRYRVCVFDCSLGKGYPVVGTAIFDLARGTFGFKLGAHPSFAVALERTFTEAFQGKSLEEFAAYNALGSTEDASERFNVAGQLTNGRGVFPASLFAGEPSWECSVWETSSNTCNEDMARWMLGALKREGRRVFIRDASHLGFPALYIVVPGMSEIGLQSFAEQLDLDRYYGGVRAMDRFPRLTKEQAKTITGRIERYVSRSLGYAEPSFAFQRPFAEGRMSPDKLLGYLYLESGSYGRAAKMFGYCVERAGSLLAAMYWRALAHYASWRDLGVDYEGAVRLLRRHYAEPIARRVASDVGGASVIESHFPQMLCYDCEDCELTKSGFCLGLVELNAMRAIRRGMGTSAVVQRATGLSDDSST